jgi:SpoIID/LytB domain protein
MAGMRSRGSLLVRAVCVALAVSVGASAPAVADSADERRDETAALGGVTVTFHGHAWGHGHGLSQYGAKARGEDGQTYREILDFYYPGTSLGQAAGRIRVLVTDDTSRDVVVADRAGLRVKALRSGRTWTPKQPAKRWRVTPATAGRSVVSYKTRRWHEWRTFRGDAEFSTRGGTLRLITPSGAVDYRGALRSATTDAGGRERDTVNVVGLEAYVRAVVPEEMPALWDADAVRAQAVAARTYAAYERADAPSSRWFDVWDTTQSQVYGGRSAEQPASNAAVRATAREVVTHERDLAFAQFARSNGGFTAQGEVHGDDVPYLPAREDTFDTKNDDWTATFSGTEITGLWADLGGELESITVERDENGAWAEQVVVTNTDGSKGSASGEEFAQWLGLRSYFFDGDPVVKGR